MLRAAALLALFVFSLNTHAQEDSTWVDEEFDFSDFELAAEPSKSYCNNKVLAQNPTPLITVYYDFQSDHALEPDPIYDLTAQAATIEANHGFGLSGNFPLLSRNSILINMAVDYNEHYYVFEDRDYENPLTRNLKNHALRRTSLKFTVFKPLNEKRFVLAQVGSELNGDYDLFAYDPTRLRVPAAVLYGFKPNDRLMWAVGASRTYLGGALNYLPVVYYYHTFRNQKWGIEAVLPSRAAVRYRLNSKTILNTGFSVAGATYHLGNFRRFEEEYAMENDLALNSTEDNIELRRSELRIGMGLYRAISDFIWVNLEAGARVNWLFNVDEDDFFRGFDDSDFYMENALGTPLYIRVNLSFVSP